MLVPKRVKHRREFRGKMRGEAKGDVYKRQTRRRWSHWLLHPTV